MDKEKFIKRAELKHGKLYDYSLVETTKNIKDKYKIICRIHGIFEQRGDAHLGGQGCGKCKKSILSDVSEFIEKADIIHNNKYNYDNVNYINCKTKVDIICPIHGIFQQSPDSHIAGHGCTLCSTEKNGNLKTRSSADVFIEKANIIHNNKYEYPDFKYLNAKEKIKILCKKHGIFHQTPNDHLCNRGCPKCGVIESKNEKEIKDFIEIELNIKTKKIRINNKEIDIYLPDYNLGIEYDGLYWHSSFFKKSDYHLNKTNICEEHDIQLLHIFEDEWLYKKEIVKSIIKAKLGIVENKIFAKNCEIREIDNKSTEIFLKNNHIQGNLKSKIRIGLFFNNNLVSLMIFKKKRNIRNEYEILRFCDKINTLVIDSADKLLKYFIINYNPKLIIVFNDRRYPQEDLYQNLGFNFIENTKPNYWYFKSHELIRFINKTKNKIMENNGYLRIYDCGNMKFTLVLI